MLGALLALASAVSITGLQTGTAGADTQYGPTGIPGGPIFPTTSLTIGNPTVVHLLHGTTWSGQALENAFNSPTPGSEARTWDLNYSNAQRIYFQRLGRAQPAWNHVVDAAGSVRLEMQYVPMYRIVHYTHAGAMCLDADSSKGAPSHGTRVQWVTCDPSWGFAPQQLWFATTTTRDGYPGVYPSLINVASAPSTAEVFNLDQAPVLAAGANIVGQRSPLTITKRSMAWPGNSAWGYQNIGPVVVRADQQPCSNKIECLVAGVGR